MVLNGRAWHSLLLARQLAPMTVIRLSTTLTSQNTSDAAISAGSRHGSSPSTNSNVGNFTMDHVTFTDVGSAFSHGSGQGTVVAMSNFNVDGTDASCFDFAEDTIAILTEGAMKNCNQDGNAGDGAIVNVDGSTGGSLVP